MSNLRKRIEGLISSTSSEEAKNVCTEALKKCTEYSIFNISPEAVEQIEMKISEGLISDLENINDSDVVNFVTEITRITEMHNLGVKKSLKSIRESELAKHPTALYMLEKLSKVESLPEWLIVDHVLESLAPFSWDPTVKQAIDELTVNSKKYSEDIKIYKAVHEAKNNSSSAFLMTGIEKHINEYLNHRTPTNRVALIESLGKYLHDKAIRNLHNVVIESENSFQLKATGADVIVKKSYSPVIISENDEIFAVNGVAYVKNGNKMRPLTEDENAKLPSYFTFISSFLSQNNVEILENSIKVFSRDKKVELVEESEGLAIFVNNKKVTKDEFHRVYLNSGVFRMEEREVISAVGQLVEHWDAIFELDFTKSIYPKGMPHRRADVFKLNENTFIFTADNLMNETRFYPNCNASQSRNLVMEFASYDLGLTFKELLSKEDKTIVDLQEKATECMDAINYLEERKNILESITDVDVRESSEVKELIAAIQEEVDSVREEYYNAKNAINAFTHVTEGLGVNAGDEVEYLKKKQ
jgi:hypothetical protein